MHFIRDKRKKGSTRKETPGGRQRGKAGKTAGVPIVRCPLQCGLSLFTQLTGHWSCDRAEPT